MEKLEDESTDVVCINIPRTLSRCQMRLRMFTKNVSRHKRMPASHILVTMISPIERNQKPYALPISCIPYASLSEGKARTVISEIVKEMCKRGMKVAGMCTTKISCLFLFTLTFCTSLGFVSNGEYNTFRSKGYTRPLSIFQIRSEVRNRYARMNVKSMKAKAMLNPIGMYTNIR